MDNYQFTFEQYLGRNFPSSLTSPYYNIIMLEGDGKFSLDLTSYTFAGYTILFTSPYQQLELKCNKDSTIRTLSFHGDFYCIEYHKKEVACNGLLFNNIYQYPQVTLSEDRYLELSDIFSKIDKEMHGEGSFSEAVLKSYLQLILALCSREKLDSMQTSILNQPFNIEKTRIERLIDENYLEQRAPAFYAEQLNFSPSALSKKTKKYFGKSPIQLIQDKVILEAKKQLHLTFKSVKEIASDLNFQDEFYFSRYFKKGVGISPTHFREKVGISIAAK